MLSWTGKRQRQPTRQHMIRPQKCGPSNSDSRLKQLASEHWEPGDLVVYTEGIQLKVEDYYKRAAEAAELAPKRPRWRVPSGR